MRFFSKAEKLYHRSHVQTKVDHIDGKLSNNRASNLHWATRSENVRYLHAKNKERKSSLPQQSKKVRATKDCQVQIFASAAEGQSAKIASK